MIGPGSDKNGHTLFSVFAIFNIHLWILIRRRIGGGGLSALPEKERGRQSWALSELRDRRLSKSKCQSWALSGASPGRSCLARLLQPPSEGLGSPSQLRGSSSVQWFRWVRPVSLNHILFWGYNLIVNEWWTQLKRPKEVLQYPKKFNLTEGLKWKWYWFQ